jgi:hypothetical protein
MAAESPVVTIWMFVLEFVTNSTYLSPLSKKLLRVQAYDGKKFIGFHPKYVTGG